MGIFDALNTAVAGLQAQSFALQNISGNIANSSTVGYKGINTYFETLVAGSAAGNQQVAGSVTAGSEQTITTAGTISQSSVATNMAINGDGFFQVQSPSGSVDGQPVFSGATDYTRQGDFQINANGYLVNGSGYYLMGTPVDPKTGNPLGNVASVCNSTTASCRRKRPPPFNMPPTFRRIRKPLQAPALPAARCWPMAA
jgi:flagellar hook protein FlgE